MAQLFSPIGADDMYRLVAMERMNKDKAMESIKDLGDAIGKSIQRSAEVKLEREKRNQEVSMALLKLIPELGMQPGNDAVIPALMKQAGMDESQVPAGAFTGKKPEEMIDLDSLTHSVLSSSLPPEAVKSLPAPGTKIPRRTYDLFGNIVKNQTKKEKPTSPPKPEKTNFGNTLMSAQATKLFYKKNLGLSDQTIEAGISSGKYKSQLSYGEANVLSREVKNNLDFLFGQGGTPGAGAGGVPGAGTGTGGSAADSFSSDLGF